MPPSVTRSTATEQVTKACQAIRDVTAAANENMTQHEMGVKAAELCHGMGVEMEDSRKFIMEAEGLTKLSRARSMFGSGRALARSERKVYLMSDCVLVSKGSRRGDTYVEGGAGGGGGPCAADHGEVLPC